MNKRTINQTQPIAHMASSLVKSLGSRILLSDGNHLPILGLGTWMAEKDACRNAALHALGLGYRLIDTASCYENEKELGSAIRESGIPREEMFITSKLWTTDHGTNKTKLAFKHSLEKYIYSCVSMYTCIHVPLQYFNIHVYICYSTIYNVLVDWD